MTTFDGLQLLDGPNTHPGSGPVAEHTREIALFRWVLGHVSDPAPCMIEVGCFWALWSLLFRQKFPQGRNVLIELGRRQLLVGQKNFALNGFTCSTYHGGVCLPDSGTFCNRKADLEYDPQENAHLVELLPGIQATDNVVGPELDFHAICKIEGVEVIDLLHLDIQGSEVPFVPQVLYDLPIPVRHFVIATHSPRGHAYLLRWLGGEGYEIRINEPFGSIGGDGLIHAQLNT